MIKLKFGVALGLAVISISATDASASPRVGQDSCSVAGMVMGGGLLDHERFSTPGFSADLPWNSVFGEAALNYNCGSWGAQVDGAAYGFWTTIPNSANTARISQGHIGGSAYWRDQAAGALGLSVSRIFQSYSDSFSAFAPSTGMWRLGGFGEFYANDFMTFGGGLYYIDGQTPLAFTAYQRGIEGDAFAKFYASNNISLSLRGDFLGSAIYNPDGSKFSGYDGTAFSTQAEFLVPETAFSVFAGARYANRSVFTQSSGKIEDVQGFVGASFSFGGPTPSSLRDRDRHGTFDNTSVFLEKLPNAMSEEPFE